MERLTRLNEVQYAESDLQKEKLIAEGFVLDEDYGADNSAALDKMTKQQLIDYAEANGIDISGADTKADILSLIKE